MADRDKKYLPGPLGVGIAIAWEHNLTPYQAISYALIIILALLLAYSQFIVAYPTVIPFPYPTAETTAAEDKGRVVMLAGSYNPPHNGHLQMLKYLSRRYGKVIAVVGFNPSKTYPVSPQSRVDMLQTMITTANLPNVSAVLVSGLIWKYAKKNEVFRMYRGIRTWDEDGSSENFLHFLNTFFPFILWWTSPCPTIFLSGDPEYNHVSSTLIREKCGEEGGNLEGLVPKAVEKIIISEYCKKEE